MPPSPFQGAAPAHKKQQRPFPPGRKRCGAVTNTRLGSSSSSCFKPGDTGPCRPASSRDTPLLGRPAVPAPVPLHPSGECPMRSQRAADKQPRSPSLSSPRRPWLRWAASREKDRPGRLQSRCTEADRIRPAGKGRHHGVPRAGAWERNRAKAVHTNFLSKNGALRRRPFCA